MNLPYIKLLLFLLTTKNTCGEKILQYLTDLSTSTNSFIFPLFHWFSVILVISFMVYKTRLSQHFPVESASIKPNGGQRHLTKERYAARWIVISRTQHGDSMLGQSKRRTIKVGCGLVWREKKTIRHTELLLLLPLSYHCAELAAD